MEKMNYDLNKTELIIGQIVECIGKMDINVNSLYKKINKMDIDGIWVCKNASYVKNKGIDLLNHMDKELENLKISIKSIENGIVKFKEIDVQIQKEFGKNS